MLWFFGFSYSFMESLTWRCVPRLPHTPFSPSLVYFFPWLPSDILYVYFFMPVHPHRIRMSEPGEQGFCHFSCQCFQHPEPCLAHSMRAWLVYEWINDNLLSVICFSNTFSMSVTWSLPSLMVNLIVQKILVNMRSDLSLFSHVAFVFWILFQAVFTPSYKNILEYSFPKAYIFGSYLNGLFPMKCIFVTDRRYRSKFF